MRATGRHGLTLIELMGCSVLLAVGAAVAVAGARHYGWVGGLVGFLLGVVGTWAAVYGTVAVAEAVWLAGRPLPQCHGGLCQTPDHYQLVNVDGDWVLRCRCGRDYVKAGRCFMERLTDGTRQPYMVHRPFRGWFPDTGPGD